MEHKEQVSNPYIFIEKKEVFFDDTGFNMSTTEFTFGDTGIRWGQYVSQYEQLLETSSNKECVISHFQLYGSDITENKTGLFEKQFVIYRESAQSHDIIISPTGDTPRVFFELIMDDAFFRNFITEDSSILQRFIDNKEVNKLLQEFTANINPQMYSVISEMNRNPYTGSLKKLYLEAKVTELFLMQIKQLDCRINFSSNLNSKDIDSLQNIKSYLDVNFSKDLSILELSKEAGINQSKLKSGFKKLFKTTVFEYINDLRLQEAKRLLLEEKMCVNEVAYIVGYTYSHYFTALFKKKFGILPKSLRSL
ncbi:helix-turn-helix domain-containing protein [Mucilaginibacter polytrichastri]|uniref:HTH araC/xylS-type domain-containing protein n=1 Tax=Mucilaginibacter polytrichastri TaxID=1302689 RepID=A0A1Q5ZWK1_9SPHI|nr:AraC family transcriptional regulator [Mucilaginibacter polytrichastri]OKS86147.1 hypothetical protein RG47T_1597 [Mucilaginibacter polytrichastri]SFT15338.1 AraC-type DNA-binding protein [Mucilaginibacter polytrichastri]